MIDLIEATNPPSPEASFDSALDDLVGSTTLNPADESSPPEYFSYDPESTIPPTYLGSVLQPETSEDGGYPALQSYAIIPHDTRSLVVMSPSSALGSLATSTQRSSLAQFGLRIYGGSIYLYRKNSSGSSSPQRNPSKDLFSQPVMEASLNRFFNKSETRLEDWRVHPKSTSGKYRLKSRKGWHTYKTNNDQRGWRCDSTGCLQLIELKSSQRSRKIACLKPASLAASALSESCKAINHSAFKPAFYGGRALNSKLHNTIGRLDIFDESLTDGVNEELVILTGAVTIAIEQRWHPKLIK